MGGVSGLGWDGVGWGRACFDGSRPPVFHRRIVLAHALGACFRPWYGAAIDSALCVKAQQLKVANIQQN